LYRVFIDEVGNHDLKSSDDPNHRYLGLTGVIMWLDYEATKFTAALNDLKQSVFATSNIVLHRREMMDADPPFHALRDSAVRLKCDELVMGLLSDAHYQVFTVVIDKKAHRESTPYGNFTHIITA
jgi:hypothetical protein